MKKMKGSLSFVGALICCFLWGSAFPCIKIGYRLFDIVARDFASQILFAGIRFFIAGIMAIILGSVIRREFLFPRHDSWIKVLKLSSFQTIGQYILFYIGLAHTTGVRSSIIEGSNVFVAIIVACLLFHQEKLTGKKILGSIIGFAGVILISIAGSSGASGDEMNFFTGDLFVFLSTVCYAFSSVFLKRYSVTENTVMLSGYQFVVGGIVMILIGVIAGGKLSVISTSGIMMLLYLALVSSVAYSLWGILLSHNPVSKIAVFGFMNPMFGVILSALLLNERGAVGLTALLALVLVCVGIYVVNVEKE